MNREYLNNKDVISLKSIGAIKWNFKIGSNDFFSEDKLGDKELICYNDLLENIHCEDIFKVDEFFKGIKYESTDKQLYNEVIFRFRNSYYETIEVLARGNISEVNSDIMEGYFFNLGNIINKSYDEAYISKKTENLIGSIKGSFIIIDKVWETITFYGDNKNIIGIDNIYAVMDLVECEKYIEKQYVKQIKVLINDSSKFKNEPLEFKIKNLDNIEKWIRLKGEMKKNLDGSLIGFEGFINDITDETEANIKLKYMKNYDELTGLHNREYLKSFIEKHIKKNKKTKLRGSLIIIDLDNFKFVNDSYGYRFGDLFIKEVSNELMKIVDDRELICKYGGDEFLVFIPSIKNLLDVEKISNKVIHRFKDPFYIEGKEVYSTASIGASVFPDDGIDFEELLKNADAAMHIAKSNGKNQYQFFNYNISYELNKIYTIQKGLRTALDKGEMFVVFQPKVELGNNKTDGFEALLRWKSEDLGFVSPAEFIPIAETTRLIIPIGNFVLEEVFAKVKYLLEEGYDNFKIALNLSEVQLRDRTMVDTFKALIKGYKIEPKYIEIEITESMLMKSFDKNIETLLEIKALGVSIALDDFGTGYSSLNYLTKLPIDVLKIDRSFVVDMIDNHKSRCIVENIIQLSHKLGIKVVAEGVEVVEQVDYLKSIYCDIVQGYYYSKPEIFENVISMLTR